MSVCIRQHDESYPQEPIISICEYPDCENRLACGRCQLDYHRNHMSYLVKISDFQQKILDQQSFNNQVKEFEELLKFKKDLISKMEEFCNEIKQGFLDQESIQQQLTQPDFVDKVIKGTFNQTIIQQKIQTGMIKFSQMLKAFDDAYQSSVIQLQVKDKKFENCIYTGQVLNSKRSGQGQARYFNPQNKSRISQIGELFISMYEGQWLNDKRNGNGYQTWINNDIYNGEYKDDLFHGQGKLQFGDGRVYEGQFQLGKMHGKGKMTYKDGSIYEGEFQDNQACGQGLFISKDHVYKGAFENNLKNGIGLMNCSDGYKYWGAFVDDERSGNGISMYPEGDLFEGYYINNVRTGPGKMIYANNDEYAGQYLNGRRNDKSGKFMFSSGDMCQGRWEKGQLIGELLFVDSKINTTNIKEWLKQHVPKILAIPEAQLFKKVQ